MTRPLPEGTVTILFTDVEGSTNLTTRKGDRHARDILRAQTELVRQQVQEHSGHEVKSLGDGFMVAFASARKAVACAVAIQRALDEHNRRQPGDPVRIRIGMNTGEAIQEEADLFGEAVHAAARVAAKAKGGQILLSDSVRAVLGRGADLQLLDRGRFTLKGFPEKWRLHEVVWHTESATATTVRLGRTPFVGREAECADLSPLLERAARGHGSLVVVGGEPGVGKTRLCEEMMAEAGRRGFATFTGHCYDTEGAPPYAPFLEVLETTARTLPQDSFRAALGDAAADMTRIMPQLRRIFPDIPPPLEMPPEQERHCLLNGVVDFIRRSGQTRPVALVLDDLHWADESTLLLLENVAQQLHDMPVVVVGTYRDVELDVQRPLAKTLESLLRRRLAYRVALKRLPQDGVAAMLRALSAQEPPPELVDVIYRETEGNPFFVEEVFRHLAEEGRLFDAAGCWRHNLSVSEVDVPEGVRLVLGRRLQRIGEESRRALTSAAAIGRVFSFDLLQELGELDADALLDALEEAEGARLIASIDEGSEARFIFAHELIRQTLLSGLSMPRRQRLHLRVADAMERTHAGPLDDIATELAHHLYQAGAAADSGKAAQYMVLAGKGALSAAAFEEALRHFDRAVPLQPADDDRARADLLYNRGLALRSLARWEEALPDWRQALTIYEELGDAEIVGHVASDIVEQLSSGSRFPEAVEVGMRGLAALGERVSADRVRLLSMTGIPLSLGGDYQLGGRMFDQGLAIGEEVNDPRALGHVLTYKALHHWAHMEMPAAAECGLRGAELLRLGVDLWGLGDALWITSWALAYLGRFGEAAELCTELEPVAIRLGNFRARYNCWEVQLQTELTLRGDIDGFESLARRVLDFGRDTGFPWHANEYGHLGLAHFWRGRWDEALEPLRESARLEPPGFFAGANWGRLFFVAASTGDEETAMAILDQKRDNLPLSGQPNRWGAWTMLFGVVQGLAELGKRDEAGALYSLVVEALGTGLLLHYPGAGLVQTVAGIAAAAGRQWDRAEEHFQAALRQAHELPVILDQPEARRWYARMLIDRDGPGDREKAHSLLSEAIDMYRRIGMPKHVEMAEALLSAR